jgi:hypothetical protein
VSDNFVQLYLNHASEYESPTSFWKWSAYATIAAILRDNCFRKRGDIFTYPNIYVLLLANSAEHRKGAPVKLCEELVHQIKNTKIISGRSSIQAILDELARGETDAKTGRIIKGGSALFSAPELSAGIVGDPEAIRILTDIYDFRENYTSRLRGAGTFNIRNICFTMLAASNEELLRTVYDSGAIFGGLLGRTFLVKPDEFRPANSLFRIKDKALSKQGLLKELEGISQLVGEFTFTKEAEDAYDSWYIPFRESYRGKSDKSGVSGRVHDSILKLSMLLCVNYTKGLEIQKQHIEEAITEGMELMPNYQNFVMGGGKSTIAETSSIFLEELYNSVGTVISRKEILGRHWQNFDSELFDKAISHLEQAGMIISQPFGPNGINYAMTKKCKDMLFSGGKQETKK